MASVVRGRYYDPVGNAGSPKTVYQAFFSRQRIATSPDTSGTSETPYYPKITPAAQKIVDMAVKGPNHQYFTWGGGFEEAYGPRYNDGDYSNLRIRPVSGPITEISKLRRDWIVIPGAQPQMPFGSPSGPQASGMDSPLVSGMANGFFTAAMELERVLFDTHNSVLPSPISDLRAEFRRRMAAPLRAFFDNTPPAPPAPPPVAPAGTEEEVIYVVGEELSVTEAPDGDNTTFIPGEGVPEGGPAGGAAEKFLPLINSTLNNISAQLSAIASKLNRIKEPNPTNNPERNSEKSGLLDLLKTGAEILSSLTGIGGNLASALGAAATAASSAADAASALDDALDTFSDLIDALVTGPEDDMVDSRFDKMADLFQYDGKSIPQYLFHIRQELAYINESLSKNNQFDILTSVLDRYFMDLEHGGIEGVKPFGGGSGDVLVVGYGQKHDEDLDIV